MKCCGKGVGSRKFPIDLREVSNPCRPLWEESRQREGQSEILIQECGLAGLRKKQETNGLNVVKEVRIGLNDGEPCR